MSAAPRYEEGARVEHLRYAAPTGSHVGARIYVAGRACESRRADALAGNLRATGLCVVSRWHGRHDVAERDLSPHQRLAISATNWRDLNDAHGLVLLAPSGPNAQPARGSLIEAGAAIGRGIPLVVVAPSPFDTSLMLWNPGAVFVRSDDDVASTFASIFEKLAAGHA